MRRRGVSTGPSSESKFRLVNFSAKKTKEGYASAKLGCKGRLVWTEAITKSPIQSGKVRKTQASCG